MTRILPLVLLCGCAHINYVWLKHGTSQLEFAQDRYQCQLETEHAGGFSAAGALLFIAIAQEQAQKRQQALFSQCMEARGYILERKP
jgi:hypothetical protein